MLPGRAGFAPKAGADRAATRMKLAIAFNIGCRIIFILQPIRCGAGRARYSSEKRPSFEQSEMAGGRLNSLLAPSLSVILCLRVFTANDVPSFLPPYLR